MKRITSLLLSLLLILLIAPAQAEAPASQFGFHIWPYRQSTSCTTRPAAPLPEATARPTQAPVPQTQPTRPSEGKATPAPQRTAAPRPTATPASSRGDYTTTSVSMQEQKVWTLLNQDRAANGLSALPLDAELSRIARIKACDMKEQHYFAHTSPTYGSAAQMLTHFGYAYRGVGENIAHHATVEKSEAAFMSSTGHRHNILGSQWARVGVGVCLDDQGFVYVCQLFVR